MLLSYIRNGILHKKLKIGQLLMCSTHDPHTLTQNLSTENENENTSDGMCTQPITLSIGVIDSHVLTRRDKLFSDCLIKELVGDL